VAERVFIGVAWPYANGSLHLGQIAGAYLPADIFARYHRLKGSRVLMVSGSDQHGTPITLRAEREGVKPEVVAARYHQEFLESFRRLGISFDLFTSTGTANHARVAQDFFLKLLDKGYLYQATVSQPFCPRCQRFLSDRYIEGTCPYCQAGGARGDQCDDCGKPLSPAELISPYCSFCGGAPEFRDSEHFFFRLSAFQERLLEWVRKQSHWRQNVLNFTLRYLESGLKDRAITRDIDWGVPVPLPGFEGKRLYVWFEAVIGYLSAAKEWAESGGDTERWRDYWQSGSSRGYYFIGKDNIVFHTIIWPAMLMGYGDLNLPYDVPANEFLMIEGRKLSTSRNWAVWLPDYLERYHPDPLRYLLSAAMPETSDTDFSWREFVRRNNDELVATYGNLVHRVLTFSYRNFAGAVPVPSYGAEATQLQNSCAATLKLMDESLGRCQFRLALKQAMDLAQEANRYLDEKSPWKVVKQDKQAAADALYDAISVISSLRIALYPFLPFSSQRLHEFLGFDGVIEDYGWQPSFPEPGQKLSPPQPLFAKLDEGLIEEELGRLRQGGSG
jgi:methionyl-tRNA synthetase